MVATLVEELVEEILIRIPPDEPAHLVSIALVCKSWRRIISDDGFLRRYRRFHGTPPLLGYIQNNPKCDRASFFPTTCTTSPVSMAALRRTLHRSRWAALDCRHSCVLIDNVSNLLEGEPQELQELIIWDLIAGGMQHLTVPPYQHDRFTGSVLCATKGCDHLDCSGGPFTVVFVWTSSRHEDMTTRASIYSLDTSAWSTPTSIDNKYYVYMRPGQLIGDAMYFTISIYGLGILNYDLCRHLLSVIGTPREIWGDPLVLKEMIEGYNLSPYLTIASTCGRSKTLPMKIAVG